MVDIKAELQSGQFSLYGQIGGLLSALLLLIISIACFVSNVLVFCLLGFVFTVLILLLEIPLVVKVMPGGPKVQKFVDYFENHYFRGALYIGFSLTMFLSTIIAVTSLILPGITLLATAACYITAGAKNQERVTSALTGGSGFVAGAQSLA